MTQKKQIKKSTPSDQGSRRAPEVSQIEIDYQTKKSVHINLTKSTHSGLRVMLLRRGVSMQEVFNRVASMMCDENPHMMKIIDDIQIEKKEKHIKQVTRSDAESIFDIIENTNPFGDTGRLSENE